MINIPYSQLELDIALLGVSNTLEDAVATEAMEEIVTFFEQKTGKTQAERNSKIAEFHGISVLDLINSPNLNILVEMFQESRTLEMKTVIMEKLGVSDKESWAIITYASKN
jgi:hypothetical protein